MYIREIYELSKPDSSDRTFICINTHCIDSLSELLSLKQNHRDNPVRIGKGGEILHCIVAWVAKGGQMSINVGVLVGRSGEKEFRNEAKLTLCKVLLKLLIDVEDACMAFCKKCLPPNDNVHLNESHKPLY
ncbi:unnamed protein product [Brugia timori]|uniref:DNA helicase n=1 Tax=Brugia timori TaxID=42155 RepID=A0A0R3Q8R8_9BILA|nr:unnamed protein product [Brugia timori]